MHEPAVRRASPEEVPIIDFGALFSPSLAERKTVARAIRIACAGPASSTSSTISFRRR